MRSFNKVFVIALPRCATVSMSDALGLLGVNTAHLGRIYGEATKEHNNPRRLMRMHEQILADDYRLDILKECDGLADYPACSFEVLKRLDQHYPGSLFINARRDEQLDRWLQSVERQFVGLQLIKQGKTATEEEKKFMQVMLDFRRMTFGQSAFDAEAYRTAYLNFQAAVESHFALRGDCLLQADISEFEVNGFAALSRFLDCPERVPTDVPFPNSNEHSNRPYEAFMLALEEGRVHSQTGILPLRC